MISACKLTLPGFGWPLPLLPGAMPPGNVGPSSSKSIASCGCSFDFAGFFAGFDFGFACFAGFAAFADFFAGFADFFDFAAPFFAPFAGFAFFFFALARSLYRGGDASGRRRRPPTAHAALQSRAPSASGCREDSRLYAPSWLASRM